jgi:hypothetical protein
MWAKVVKSCVLEWQCIIFLSGIGLKLGTDIDPIEHLQD